MASQIIFFEKSKCDYSNRSATATATQGNTTAKYVLNRNNNSAWLTTGSVDADNSALTVSCGDYQLVSEVLILEHNFKSFKLEGFTGLAWVTLIDTVACAESSTRISFAKALYRDFKLTVRGTQVANKDKYLYQFVVTNPIGKLNAWPMLNNPTHGQNKRVSKMLSGKSRVSDNVGGFSVELKVSNWKNAADLAIVEQLYFGTDGFLVWLCGGDEAQFSSVRVGYRKRDLYLMKCQNEYQPEFVKGLYTTGLNLAIKLVEVA